MILAILLFVVFLLVTTGFLFFFFCFFVPALKSKYYGVSSILSTEKNVTYELDKDDLIESDITKHAVVTTAAKDEQTRRMQYTGLKKCAVFYDVYESEYNDYYGCVGFGDCMNVCRQNAIQIENGIAVVTDLCDGCGECLSVCPVRLISLVEKNEGKTSLPAKKHFKFWRNCYKIIKQRS
ncbi:MAG: 4Fe-4S binding protein [Treponema sp.]|nr:4Fe-4S binding protein [Treponema sp.]